MPLKAPAQTRAQRAVPACAQIWHDIPEIPMFPIYIGQI